MLRAHGEVARRFASDEQALEQCLATRLGDSDEAMMAAVRGAAEALERAAGQKQKLGDLQAKLGSHVSDLSRTSRDRKTLLLRLVKTAEAAARQLEAAHLQAQLAAAQEVRVHPTPRGDPVHGSTHHPALARARALARPPLALACR